MNQRGIIKGIQANFQIYTELFSRLLWQNAKHPSKTLDFYCFRSRVRLSPCLSNDLNIIDTTSDLETIIQPAKKSVAYARSFMKKLIGGSSPPIFAPGSENHAVPKFTSTVVDVSTLFTREVLDQLYLTEGEPCEINQLGISCMDRCCHWSTVF